MNNTLSKAIIFITGATVGSLITWKILKTKYEQYIEEEIISVKEAYEKIYDTSDNFNIEESKSNESEVEEYKNIAKKYINDNEEEEEEEDDMDMPYVISQEEFADSDYETATFWYFSDGTLTDEQYNIIEDVEETIGYESLEHFGDYADDPDTIYVRNDYLQVDFEICKDLRNYSEI